MEYGYKQPKLHCQSHLQCSFFSPTNLHLWLEEDPACLLCAAPATLKHIMVACKASPLQRRYTWHHNQILRCLALALKDKRTSVNAILPQTQPTSSHFPPFTHGGEKQKTNPLITMTGKCMSAYTKDLPSHPVSHRPTCILTFGPTPVTMSSLLSSQSPGKTLSRRHLEEKGYDMPN